MGQERFDVIGPNGKIPGWLYTPDSVDGPVPLVLLGHGGGGSKDDERFVSLGHFFSRIPAAVLCIDGPVHGERTPKAESRREAFRIQRRALSDAETTHNFVKDWVAAAAAARGLDIVDPTRTGYCGFSMGTMFGVPACAGLGDVKAAVFGVGGIPGPGALTNFLKDTSPKAAAISAEEDKEGVRGQLLLEAAPKLTGTEVLMLNMSQDEIFSMDGALELFAAFPGPKRMAVWEGGHLGLPREAMQMAASFLTRVLHGEETR